LIKVGGQASEVGGLPPFLAPALQWAQLNGRNFIVIAF